MAKSNVFLVSWDNTGLEAVVPISKLEAEMENKRKEREWAILADPDMRDPGDLGARMIKDLVGGIVLRARYNPQRHYEVYTIHVTAGISEDDLRNLFEENPQGAADLIRERGSKVYSDRVDTSKVKIV